MTSVFRMVTKNLLRVGSRDAHVVIVVTEVAPNIILSAQASEALKIFVSSLSGRLVWT